MKHLPCKLCFLIQLISDVVYFTVVGVFIGWNFNPKDSICRYDGISSHVHDILGKHLLIFLLTQFYSQDIGIDACLWRWYSNWKTKGLIWKSIEAYNQEYYHSESLLLFHSKNKLKRWDDIQDIKGRRLCKKLTQNISFMADATPSISFLKLWCYYIQLVFG